MGWFTKKQLCCKCNTNYTKREFEDEIVCNECVCKILLSKESNHNCPVDGSVMKKEFHEEIIIDRCPDCHGVWLDEGELIAIKEAVESGDSQFATGLALGICI